MAITRIARPVNDGIGRESVVSARRARYNTCVNQFTRVSLLLNIMLAQLIPINGGPPVTLAQPVTLVGRSPRLCDLSLDHTSVSKLHCILVKTDGLVYMRNLGSTNGTRVNGQRVCAGPCCQEIAFRLREPVFAFIWDRIHGYRPEGIRERTRRRCWPFRNSRPKTKTPAAATSACCRTPTS